jgi:type IV secretion system protein TrbI
MPPASDPPNVVPNVEDKRKPAPGVLPKSAQTWVVVGLTALIMFTVWVSGPTKGAQSAKKADAPRTEPVVGLSSTEIVARLEQERREQQAPFASADGSRNQPPEREDTSAGGSESPAPAPVEPDPIRQDMRRREYASRFASSVSLSYRPTAGSDSAPTEENPASQPALDLSPPGISTLASRVAGAPESPGQFPTAAASPPLRNNLPNFNQAGGKDYVVFEGTVLETLLVTRLNSDFSGPVICMLTNSIYSHDGQRLLVPAGTKVLGQTKRVEGFGQTRMAIVFHRLIMPDGYSVDLDQFQGLNQIGETGLRDKVNHHYFEIFGASVAVGAIAGLAEAGTNTSSIGLAPTTADAYREGVAASLSQSSLHILDRFLNLLPTITIREGRRVKVYLTQDLLLPDYAQHEMPSNL